MAFPIKIENKPTEGILDLLELPNTRLVKPIKKGVAVVESAVVEFTKRTAESALRYLRILLKSLR